MFRLIIVAVFSIGFTLAEKRVPTDKQQALINAVNHKLLAKLTDPSIVKIGSTPSHSASEHMAAYIRRLIAKGDRNGFLQLVQKVREQEVYEQRLKKCVEVIGSKAVCTNNVGFYLWAQMLAKDIMKGQY